MKINLTRPLVFVDLETTGIDYAKDRIVEIAAVKLLPDGNVVEKVHRINPTIPIPKEVTAIHGITDEDVKDAPKFSDVAKEYFLFMNDCDLAGFNSNRFDFPFLTEEFLRAGVSFETEGRKFIDVQRIFHNMEKRSLEAAVKFYLLRNHDGAHGAAADARATMEVLQAQLDKYPDALKNDTQFLHNVSKDGDFVDMGRKMYFDKGVEKFGFGKHKGIPVEDVFRKEPGYYEWILKADFPLDMKAKIKAIKERMK